MEKKLLCKTLITLILSFVCGLTGFIFLDQPRLLYPNRIVNVTPLNFNLTKFQIRCDALFDTEIFELEIWPLCKRIKIYNEPKCELPYFIQPFEDMIVGNCRYEILKNQFPTKMDLHINYIAFCGFICLSLSLGFFVMTIIFIFNN